MAQLLGFSLNYTGLKQNFTKLNRLERCEILPVVDVFSKPVYPGITLVGG